MVSSVNGAAGCSAAAIYSAHGRGPSDPAAMQEKLFNKLDVNGDGSIDQSELGDFLDFVSSATGSKTQTDASQLFKAIDTDSDGSISKQDLTDGMKKLFEMLRSQLAGTSSEQADATQGANQPDTKDLFATIDKNGDGSISQDELGSFLSQKPGQTNGERGPGGHLFSRIETLLDQYRSTAAIDSAAKNDAPEAVLAVA